MWGRGCHNDNASQANSGGATSALNLKRENKS